MSEGSTSVAGGRADDRTRFPEDKRGRRRYGTVMPATVVLPDYARIPCVVRDLSGSGAKINLSRRHTLPDRIWIVIPQMTITRRATLIWRNGEFAGIAFERPLE